MSDFTDRLKSRKFLLAVFGLVFAFLTDILGVQIDPNTWNTVITLILGYITAEGAKDVIDALKRKK